MKRWAPALALAAAIALPWPAAAQLAEQRLPACLACHGASGASKQAGVPSLGAMPADYVLTQLLMFREGQRVAPPMNAMAAGLSDDDLRTLGDVVSSLPAPAPDADPLTVAEQERGLAMVNQYHCNSCHGAGLAGQKAIPRIAGQREEYLLAALRAYKSGTRPGYNPAMSEASQDIKPDDMPALARFVARYP